MFRRLVASLAALCFLTPVFADSAVDRWNLAELYTSIEAWNADAAKLEAQITAFVACKGHLGDSAARFRISINLPADMSKRHARMALYSSEQLAEDTGAALSLELSQKADILGTRVNEADSVVNPEILRVGKKRIDRFLAQDASLRIYRHPLDELLRAAPHTLDAAASRSSRPSA